MTSVREDICTRGEEEARMPISIQLIEGDREERIQWVALASSTIGQVSDRGVRIQASHLIRIVRIGHRGRPREVLATDVLCGQGYFYPVRGHLRHITI